MIVIDIVTTFLFFTYKKRKHRISSESLMHRRSCSLPPETSDWRRCGVGMITESAMIRNRKSWSTETTLGGVSRMLRWVVSRLRHILHGFVDNHRNSWRLGPCLRTGSRAGR